MKRVLALLFVCACYTRPPPPAQPMYQQQGAWQPPPGDWSCFDMESAAARGSLCYADFRRCDDERRAAEADGARTGACHPQSPVACFQLQNDPNPAMEMCAASIDDCELWRRIDQDKNGQTGAPCDWRHAPGLQ